MSLVGTRPPTLDEWEKYELHHRARLAIQRVNTMIENNNTNYILDADIKGFFDNLDHEWIIKFVESRIKDANITRLMELCGVIEKIKH